MQVRCRRNDGSVNSYAYNLGMCLFTLGVVGLQLDILTWVMTASTETVYNDNGQLKCFGVGG